jgi:hypothetical protein
MGRIRKSFVVALILVMAISSLGTLMVKPVIAQSTTPIQTPTSQQVDFPSKIPIPAIPTPSVPEFSLKYSDTFNIVPSTTTATTNPYTGKTTTTTIPEQHIENIAINITIKNQPFPSTVSGNITGLYYDIRYKGHFEEKWGSLNQFPINASSGILPVATYGYLPIQSSSENTTLQFSANSYQSGDKIDFQVEAILGYNYTTIVNFSPEIGLNESIFAYQVSGWSPTQTITIPNTSTNTPLNLLIAAFLAIIIALVIVVLLLFRRYRKITSLGK